MSQISVRLPLVQVREGDESYLMTLVIGKPSLGAEFGDAVQVSGETLYVAGADVAPMTAVVPEVLAMLGFRDHDTLHGALERVYGTGLPPDPTITIYTLTDAPVEEFEWQEVEDVAG